MAGRLSVGTLPERDEVEDLLGFFAFAQIGIGVTEGAASGVLSQEGEDTGLAAAACRYEMALDDGIFAVVGDRMEVQVEGRTVK